MKTSVETIVPVESALEVSSECERRSRRGTGRTHEEDEEAREPAEDDERHHVAECRCDRRSDVVCAAAGQESVSVARGVQGLSGHEARAHLD